MKHFTFHISHFTLLLLFAASMLACSSDSDSPAPDPVIPAQRTIIAYFDGNNSLSSDLKNDISEIEAGTKGLSAATNVIVFANIYGKKPYIAEMVNGKSTTVREWDKTFFTTNPDSILSVMQWIVAKYPANEYGIIFGGHGTGSIVYTDTIPTTLRPAYAYGNDFNTTPSQKPLLWINTSTLAAVISHLPERPRFIFFDCCLMQDYDVACQFKKYTDYIIAPVCETPAAGAPYHQIVPLLSINDVEVMCDTILTTYQKFCIEENPNHLPICISAIRTRNVDDLQVKTNAALQEIKQNTALPYDYTKVIYYFREEDTSDPVLYDLKSFLYEQNKQDNLSDETYNAFVSALEKCIFSSRKSNNWTNYRNRIHFTDFDVEDYNYGGLSITKEAIEK